MIEKQNAGGVKLKSLLLVVYVEPAELSTSKMTLQI